MVTPVIWVFSFSHPTLKFFLPLKDLFQHFDPYEREYVFRSSTLLKSTVICAPSGDVKFPKPKTKKNEKKKQPTHAKIVSVKIPQWITTQNKKRKRKEEDEYHDNKKKKIEKTAKTKCKFHGEELLGPQASLRVTLCPPAPKKEKKKKRKEEDKYHDNKKKK